MRQTSKKGFTLIELILYVSMTGVFLFTLSLFLTTLLSGRIKHHVITEVESAGAHMTSVITSAVRQAESISEPNQGQKGAVLQLTTSSTSNDPTLFDLNNKILRISEGGGAPIALHDSRIMASAIEFKNVSRDNTPGLVSFQFTLTYGEDGTQEFVYSKTFYGSAALR